jgi:hypothetical protein
LPKVWLLIVTVLIAVSVIVGIVVAVTTGDDELLSASSPEGIVQRYIKALREEDYPQAYNYLSGEWQNDCSYEQFVRWWPSRYHSTDSQVTLEQTRIGDDRAQVTVRFTEMTNTFPPVENSYEVTYHLKREDEEWRLSVLPDGPWPCPPVKAVN